MIYYTYFPAQNLKIGHQCSTYWENQCKER